jgi:hypothetical protein
MGLTGNYRKNGNYCRFIVVLIWDKKGDFWPGKSFGRVRKRGYIAGF